MPLDDRSSMGYHSLRTRRSVIKMLSVVVIIYFVSFSPQVLIFVLFDSQAITPVPRFIQTHYFLAFSMLLVTISSASNPIVYAIFSSKFRRRFVELVQRVFGCVSISLTENLSNGRRDREITGTSPVAPTPCDALREPSS